MDRPALVALWFVYMTTILIAVVATVTHGYARW